MTEDGDKTEKRVLMQTHSEGFMTRKRFPGLRDPVNHLGIHVSGCRSCNAMLTIKRPPVAGATCCGFCVSKSMRTSLQQYTDPHRRQLRGLPGVIFLPDVL